MIESIHNTIAHLMDQLAMWVMLAALAGVATLLILPILERGQHGKR